MYVYLQYMVTTVVMNTTIFISDMDTMDYVRSDACYYLEAHYQVVTAPFI